MYWLPVMDFHPTALIKYDAACYALQECARVDEAKSILDKVEALRAYAKQQKDIDMECWLAELKLRARRKIGEISKYLETITPQKSGAMAHTGMSTIGHTSKKNTLKSAGISHAVSVRCEQIADIDKAEFEAVVTEAKEKQKPVTYLDVEKVVRKKERKKKQQAKEDAAATAALEAYLRSKNLQRPMLGAQRRVEARIGQLLGEAKSGPKQSSPVRDVSAKNDRSDFRLLSRGFECLTDEEWRKSRRALVSLLRL